MSGSWPAWELPGLNALSCEITSKETKRYNCLAWAAQEDFRWWWPDPLGVGYWPPSVTREVSIQAFMDAYATLGYTLCLNASLEDGVEKLAIYAVQSPLDGDWMPTHAALQLPSGLWSSKLGPFEDVSHNTPDAVSGPVYGKPVVYMCRLRVPNPSL